jgi:hypothetical protein
MNQARSKATDRSRFKHSWFFGAPSVGINGWFSNNGTFLMDAGHICP